MIRFAFVTALFSLAAYGARVHRTVGQTQGGLLQRHDQFHPLSELRRAQSAGRAVVAHPLNMLVVLLMASNPASGWHMTGTGPCRCSSAMLPTGRHMHRICMGVIGKPGRRPATSAPSTFATGRRAACLTAAIPILAAASRAVAATAVKVPDIEDFSMSENGLRWYDLRPGSGEPPQLNQTVVIDYQMTRRAGQKIYSTKDTQTPFSWTLGDGTVIPGLEQGVLGGQGVPPLLPGGARRLVIPQDLGYADSKGLRDISLQGGFIVTRELQPIPPSFVFTLLGDKVNSYTRFQELYQNPRRAGQPDLIMDVILSK